MKKLINSKLLLQVIVASMVATLATAGIVGAATTIGSNINTAGTLDVTSLSTLGNASTTVLSVSGGTFLATASSTGAVKFATINSDTGAISFGDENLTTTGTLSVTGLATFLGGATTTQLRLLNGELITNATDGTISFGAANLDFSGSASTTGSGSLKSATINSDTGAISFGNENLTTTGILTFATASSTGAGVTSVKLNGMTVYGDLTVTGTFTPAITAIANNFAIGGGSSASQTLTGDVSGTDTVMTFGSGDITVTTGSFTTANAFLFNTASSSAGSTGSLKVLTIDSQTGTVAIAATASTTGSAVLKSATINSDTGAISFGDENLTTTGTLSVTGLATFLGGATTTQLRLLNGELITNATDGVIQLGGIASSTSITLLNGETITNATDGTISFGAANLDFSGSASTTGSGSLKSATINSDTGAISFGDENLTTTGTLSTGAATVTTASSTGTVKFPRIDSDTNTVNFYGYATTTSDGVVMPTQKYTTDTGCTSAVVGGLMFNTAKKILCVCVGTSWVAATSTGACF